jgi:hypothetical protein
MYKFCQYIGLAMYIFGDFFTNSSGHHGQDLRPDPETFKLGDRTLSGVTHSKRFCVKFDHLEFDRFGPFFGLVCSSWFRLC